MSIYVSNRLVIDDAEHERILPLICRAARFGPYFWLAIVAALVCGITVYAATGSWLAACLAALSSSARLAVLSVDADLEHAVQKWLGGDHAVNLKDRARLFSGEQNPKECQCKHKLQGTGAVYFQSVGLLHCSTCRGYQLIRKPIK